jgi:hypothetical protein
MRVIFLLFLIAFSYKAGAQDLTGVWRGHFRSNSVYDRSLSDDDRYKFEVQISQHSKTFEAVTYSYKTTVFYGKAEADGTVNDRTQKVLLRELKIVEVRMLGGDACNMTCFLQYSKIGDEEFLEGTYTSMNTRDSSSCGKGSVFLRKVPTSDFYEEPFLNRDKEDHTDKKKTPSADRPPLANNKPVTHAAPKKTDALKKVPPAPEKKPSSGNSTVKNSKPQTPAPKTPVKPALVKANTNGHSVQPLKPDSSIRVEKRIGPIVGALPQEIANRKNELVRTITVSANEIELNIYDDGAIDHDTVSVYLDKKLVVSHAMLTEKAIVVRLHLDDINDYHEVVMVADNEGEIPPNTSLMIVKAGDKQYEVRIVSTEQKNATVVFKYEKKP